MELLRRSVHSYAGYVEEFQALEALGPSEDQAILAALTAHEIRLIESMRAEIATKAPMRCRNPSLPPPGSGFFLAKSRCDRWSARATSGGPRASGGKDATLHG